MSAEMPPKLRFEKMNHWIKSEKCKPSFIQFDGQEARANFRSPGHHREFKPAVYAGGAWKGGGLPGLDLKRQGRPCSTWSTHYYSSSNFCLCRMKGLWTGELDFIRPSLPQCSMRL